MMNKTEERSYGQGSQGEKTLVTPNKPKLAAKLKYSFDNSIAKSGVFVTWMFVLMIIFSAILLLIRIALFSFPLITRPEGGLEFNFENFLGTFASLLGKDSEPTLAERIMQFLTWGCTIALGGSVTAFIVSTISRTFERLRKGKSPIIVNDHTLILGWSNRIYPILKELAIANSNVKKASVVIFSSMSRDFMEGEIEDRASDLGKLKVVTRTGDVTNPEDLKRTNIANAKSIIVLDSDESGDANVVSAVLAIKAVNPNTAIRIITEIDDENTGDALTSATQGQVIAVRSQEIIARVTAQASRRPGLAAVVLDLLDFDGDEIYFADVPALVGQTYADALLAFNEACVIGLLNADGTSMVNPAQSTEITAGMKVIAIAEDDDKVIYTGVRDDLANTEVKPVARKKEAPESLLIIGWSSMGRTVLNELAGFLPEGSTVDIVAQARYVAPEELENLNFGEVKVTFTSVSGDNDDLIAAAQGKKFNEVIVLGYRNSISQSEADAQTMLTMLQMNQLFAAEGNGVEPTRLVAEILDSRKSALARVAAVDDLVVSDSLAALLIAQISENPALAPIFEDLFDAEGATLNVRDITDYTELGQAITFAELVAIGRNHGESVIGYRLGSGQGAEGSTGVVLNPAKTSEFIPVAGDSLVVIGDLS
jgi:voltage-gated potassium channel Kch